jgi:hypothetical protein
MTAPAERGHGAPNYYNIKDVITYSRKLGIPRHVTYSPHRTILRPWADYVYSNADEKTPRE